MPNPPDTRPKPLSATPSAPDTPTDANPLPQASRIVQSRLWASRLVLDYTRMRALSGHREADHWLEGQIATLHERWLKLCDELGQKS